MWKLIASSILRYRILWLSLVVVITAFMGYHARDLEPSYEFASLLPDDNETHINYKQFKKVFGQDGNVMVMGIQDQTLNELDDFTAWCEMSERLEKIDGVMSVLSLTKALNMVRNDSLKRFDMTPVVSTMPKNQQALDSLMGKLKSYPLYEGVLYNQEQHTSLIALTLDRSYLNKKTRTDLIDAIVKESSVFENGTGVKIHYSGLPYIRTVNSQKVKKEISLFIFLAMGVTAFIMFLFFRSVTATIFSMLVVGVGVIWSMRSMVLMGYKITILTALIPPLIIVIGIPNCIFLLNKYHYEFRNHGNKIKALKRVIEKVGNATLMTNATTASGFATFALTETSILVEFGIIASMNILMVFILSLLIIPSIYSFLNPPKSKHLRHLKRSWMKNVIEWMATTVRYNRKGVYITTAILVLIALYGVSKIKTTGNMLDDIPREDPIYVDLLFFEKNFEGVMPFEITVDTKKKNGVTRLSVLKKIAKLEKLLALHPELSKPVSVSDFVKFSKQSYYNGNPKYYELPTSQERSWIMSYLSNTNDNSALMTSFVDSTGQIARISARMADIGTKEMKRLKAELRPEIDKIFNPEKYDVDITGSSVLFLEGTNYLIKNLFTSLMLAVVLIALFMAFMFSSWRMVLVSLIPNLIPLLFTGALMGYFGISIKPSTILVFSIAFGISVDDTIHFLAKYRQELKARRWHLGPAVFAALRETGVSMIYTSIVLFFGFSIFIASEFGGTVALGLLVSVTLMIAMTSNLILLPCLLLSLEKLITTRAFKEPMISILDEEEDIELDALEVKRKEKPNV